METDIKQKVTVLKALADDTRYAMVMELAQHESLHCHELSVKFDLSQPTLSHHFKRLADAGVVTTEKDGTHVIFTLQKKYLKRLGIAI